MAVPEHVLGLESSCDDMAAAIVRGGVEVVASVVRDQTAVHEPYGGVVPELASRDHVRTVSGVVEAALSRAGVGPEALDGIAVTAGPGLVGSLLVGLSFGKALAFRLGIPVVGVHHVSGHLASAEVATRPRSAVPAGSLARATTVAPATPARTAVSGWTGAGRSGARR